MLWKEAAERKISLEDWDGDTVGRLVEFLYTGSYQYPKPVPIGRPVPAASGGGSSRLDSLEVLQSCDSGDDGPLRLDPGRPLTPLDRYLCHALSDDHKTGTEGLESLESFEPAQYDYRETLLSHAKVYALAHYKSINPFKTLALKHLTMTLSRINPIQPESHIASNVIDLISYVYSHTDPLITSEEPLRRLSSQFAALNFPALQATAKMTELMGEGGEFVKDLMTKVGRRLISAEKGVHSGMSLIPIQFVSGTRVRRLLLGSLFGLQLKTQNTESQRPHLPQKPIRNQ